MEIVSTLFNFNVLGSLESIFKKFSKEFILKDGIFYKKQPPKCPRCDTPMVHNGYNYRQKKNYVKIKIGKYKCPHCESNFQESSKIFHEILSFLKGPIQTVILKMRAYGVSYEHMSDVMQSIIPMEKDQIYGIIEQIIEQTTVEPPKAQDIQVIFYDEQFPSVNGIPHVRMAIIDCYSRTPYTDEIVMKNDSETMKQVFLASGLDFNKPTIVVTDLDRKYPAVLDELFGENLIHQPCLFHLFKLIRSEFPKECSIGDELLIQRIFNVFYDHSVEIQWLEKYVEEEQKILSEKTKKQYQVWLKNIRQKFYRLCHELKVERRRNNENRRVRFFSDIVENLTQLLLNIDQYSPIIQKRLIMIDKNFVQLTNFCEGHNIPTTSNGVENYFSSTLKLGWKRLMRTVDGLKNHLKLMQMKHQNLLSQSSLTIIEAFFPVQLLFQK